MVYSLTFGGKATVSVLIHFIAAWCVFMSSAHLCIHFICIHLYLCYRPIMPHKTINHFTTPNKKLWLLGERRLMTSSYGDYWDVSEWWEIIPIPIAKHLLVVDLLLLSVAFSLMFHLSVYLLDSEEVWDNDSKLNGLLVLEFYRRNLLKAREE